MSLVRPSLTGVVFGLVAGIAGAAEKPKPEQLLKLHLDEGLGPADARARRSRLVRGTSLLASRAIGSGTLAGSFQLASDAQSSRLFVQFGTNDHEGETLGFDGNSVEVGFGQRSSGKRSALGSFVVANDVILREGLFGGVLNAAWPLLSRLEERFAGFERADGLMLPRTWTVRYERSGRTTVEWKYAFEVDSIEDERR